MTRTRYTFVPTYESDKVTVKENDVHGRQCLAVASGALSTYGDTLEVDGNEVWLHDRGQIVMHTYVDESDAQALRDTFGEYLK